MKLNSGGLKLCAVYLVYVVVLLAISYSSDDVKGHVVLAGFTWLPGGVAFALFNLFPLVDRFPWIGFLIPLVSFLIVYLIGWMISAIKQHFKAKRAEAVERLLTESRQEHSRERGLQ